MGKRGPKCILCSHPSELNYFFDVITGRKSYAQIGREIGRCRNAVQKHFTGHVPIDINMDQLRIYCMLRAHEVEQLALDAKDLKTVLQALKFKMERNGGTKILMQQQNIQQTQINLGSFVKKTEINPERLRVILKEATGEDGE